VCLVCVVCVVCVCGVCGGGCGVCGVGGCGVCVDIVIEGVGFRCPGDSPRECPVQTWSATRIVIGASRTRLAGSKYFLASSGRDCLQEVEPT